MKRYRCVVRRVVWLVVVALSPVLASAQSLDVVAPDIKHVPGADELDAGTPLTISATVTDDVAVASVVLYYRVQTEQDYRTIEMRRLRSTDMFVATIPESEVREPGVDYYFEAKDSSDNTRLIGYSFSPLKIAVAPSSVPIASATAESAAEETPDAEPQVLGGSWVWWVLGAGAVAALASGSSGGGSGNSIVIEGPLPE